MASKEESLPSSSDSAVSSCAESCGVVAENRVLPSGTENVVEPSQGREVQPTQYRLYKRRWYMLVVVCILNISNAMVSRLFVLL